MRRQDAATARAAIRFDARPTDREICFAKATAFHSSVPKADRETVTRQIAERAAWLLARDRYIHEATQIRLDSLDEAHRAPTASDRAQASHELTAGPLVAAAAHEPALTPRRKKLPWLSRRDSSRATPRRRESARLSSTHRTNTRAAVASLKSRRSTSRRAIAPLSPAASTRV